MTLVNAAGDSQEFVSLREYRPGDSMRAIHWRSLAKAGKPIVKEYRPEYFSRFALILDTFADTVSDQVFEDAVSVAASLAAAIDMRDHLLDTIFVGDKAYCFTTGCGLGEQREVLRILACVAPALQASFSQLEQMVLQQAARFSGCILVLLGWDEARRCMAKRLRARGITVQVLVIGEAAMDIEQAGLQTDGDEFVSLISGRIDEDLARL